MKKKKIIRKNFTYDISCLQGRLFKISFNKCFSCSWIQGNIDTIWFTKLFIMKSVNKWSSFKCMCFFFLLKHKQIFQKCLLKKKHAPASIKKKQAEKWYHSMERYIFFSLQNQKKRKWTKIFPHIHIPDCRTSTYKN